MKFKFISLNAFVIIFSIFLITSCGDNKNEKKEVPQEESKKELSAHDEYQCPMDCEKGKTYSDTGSCPVCKMDLKEFKNGDSMTCTQHADGNCSCEGDQCKCVNCPEHSKAVTCTQHADGNCSCEGDKCKCENCKEHAKAMTCNQHADGNCTCEGDQCKCDNCPEHS